MVKMVHASIGGDLEKICEDKSLWVAFWKIFRSMAHISSLRPPIKPRLKNSSVKF
jgi:hypothetical protein